MTARISDPRAAGALAVAAMLFASCSGTLPGVQAPPERERPARRIVIHAQPEAGGPGGAPIGPAVSVAPSEGGSAEAAPQAEGAAPLAPARPAPPVASAPPAASPPPAPAVASDGRDRQFEILNEAVTALRQEVARSYAHSQELTQENQRLRALVSALRSELGKTRAENKAIQNQLRTVEKRLKETRIPPPEAGKTGGGQEPAAEPGKTAAANPPPQGAPAEPAGDAAQP